MLSQRDMQRFNQRLETRTTRVSRRDYDFEKPQILPEGAVAQRLDRKSVV